MIELRKIIVNFYLLKTIANLNNNKGKQNFQERTKKFEKLSTNVFLNGPISKMPVEEVLPPVIEVKPKADRGTFGDLMRNARENNDNANKANPTTSLKFADQILDSPKAKKNTKKGKGKKKGDAGKDDDTKTTNEYKDKMEGKALTFKPGQFNVGKGGNNYQRLDMKGKYKDKMSGTVNNYKTKYLANGKKKSFYKDVLGKQVNQPFDLNENEDGTLNEDMPQTATVRSEHLLDENALINRNNVFYKLVNKAVKLLMINNINIPDSVKVRLNEDKNTLTSIETAEKSTYEDVLKKNFGFDCFYDFQTTAQGKLEEGHNLLIDYYTGAGKSQIFEFWSVIRPGLTIVLLPFLSVMVDMIRKVPDFLPSICYNSWLTWEDRRTVKDLLTGGKIKLLFVTPELFCSDISWHLIKNNVKINMCCIDEAHCLSEWSHSFRHAYALIAQTIKNLQSEEVVESLNKICKLVDQDTTKKTSDQNEMIVEELPKQTDKKFPVLCLTATSSRQTEHDVITKINIFADNIISSGSYIRKNLHINFSLETQMAKNTIKIFDNRKWKGLKPIIIYVNFKSQTEIVANCMKQCGYEAVSFNADMNEFQKLNILQQFQKQSEDRDKPAQHASKIDQICNKSMNIECIVSTVSLSVGLDHKHVRGVVHYTMPRNIENYLQEIGRSGRDGESALCHSFVNDSDYFFQRGRVFTEYLYNRDSIKDILELVLNIDERKISLMKKKSVSEKNDQKDDVLCNKDWKFVKNDDLKNQFSIRNDVFLTYLHKVKNMCNELNVDFDYTNSCEGYGIVKQLKNTQQNEYHNHPIIKKIKLCAKNIKNSFRFSIALVSNNLGVHPFLFVSKMKELAKKQQFTFMACDWGVFYKEISQVPTDLIETFNIDAVADRLITVFEKQRMSQCEKLDAFYSLMKKYAKKSINDFREQDVFNNHSLDMEEYVRTYFREGAHAMKELLVSRGFKREPVLFLKTDEDSCAELRECIEEFIENNQKFCRNEIEEKGAIGPFYVDFIKLLLGVVSDTFTLGEWKDNEIWGSYEHYDLGESLPMIHKYFEDFVKDQKQKGHDCLKYNKNKAYKKLLIKEDNKHQNLEEVEEQMNEEDLDDVPQEAPKNDAKQSDDEAWEDKVDDADMREYYKEIQNQREG